MVPRWDGNRSPGTLSLDILRAAESVISCGSGAGASGPRLLVTHSGQIQCSASLIY